MLSNKALSVHEHPSNEGLSNPHYFGRASAGLQEHRMQLHLLKLESDKYSRECKTPALDKDILLSNSCSTKYPVDLNVFEKLEGKYGLLLEWSRLERRLLYDLISSGLTEILSSKRELELAGDRPH